jgi:predicted HAD superfamily Cof-like phosphohydrolase
MKVSDTAKVTYVEGKNSRNSMTFRPWTALAQFFQLYEIKLAAEDAATLDLGRSLIEEETAERAAAVDLLDQLPPGNDAWHEARAEYAAETADLIYVLCFDAYARGVNLGPFLDAIHAANLAKVWDDGLVHRSSAGKVLKPPTWIKPDFRAVLDDQQTVGDTTA